MKSANDIRIEFKDVVKGGFEGRVRSVNMAAKLLSNPARVILGKTSFKNFDRQILSGISFTVRQGESLAIVGAKRSGKSTIAKMTVGMVRPDSGHVKVIGKPLLISHLGKFHKPMLTAREALSLSMRIYNPNYREHARIAEEAFEFADLRKYQNTLLYDLEKWQMHRLALAALLFTPADIYVFDDVFGGGDDSYREKCFARVREIAANNTCLIVTRQLTIASTLTPRVLFLEGGKLLQNPTGAVEEDGSIDLSDGADDGDGLDDEMGDDDGADLSEGPTKLNEVLTLKSVRVNGAPTHYLTESLIFKAGDVCEIEMEIFALDFFKCDEFNVCIHSNLVRAPLLVTQLRAPEKVWKFAAGSTHRVKVRLTIPDLGKGLYSFSLFCRNLLTRPYEGFLKLARFGLKDSPVGFSGSILLPAEVKETTVEVQP